VIKTLVLLGIVVASAASEASAQDRGPKYSVGIRSGLITGTMNLSGLDPAFDNLAPDGPQGPHMSGFFFLYNVRRHLRLGVETLVSNSNKTLRTSMNYQAAGPVVDVTYGDSWFISGGMHVGGVVVNAMARDVASQPTGAATGSFFKSDGYFAAPSADVGYRFRLAELGLFIKHVNLFGGKERGGLSDFSSTFGGLRLAFRL
jgi:hypothetical protein